MRKSGSYSGRNMDPGVLSSESDPDEGLEEFASEEERLLSLARNGKERDLLELLRSNEEADEGSKLNLDCKGEHYQ